MEVIVSIPFIAGQWSLRSLLFVHTVHTSRFQSPSLRGSGRFINETQFPSTAVESFNPLHCGAVVAS